MITTMQMARNQASMSIPSAKAWFFDFDGTLTDYDGADARALEVLRLTHAPESNAKQFSTAAASSRAEYYRSVAELGPREGLNWHRLRGIFRMIGEDLPDSALATYEEALRKETVAVVGARVLLEYLHRRVWTGVITNAYDAVPQRHRIASTGLEDLLNDIIVAVEIGHFKPEPEIMWVAAERAGVAPNRCVYVGDSITFDVAAARSAGMLAILVTPSVPVSLVDGARPHLWVPNLTALKEACLERCRRT